MGESSWRLKIKRAEKHLAELSALVPIPDKTSTHPVSEEFDPDHDGGPCWIYRLNLVETFDADTAAAVLGDVLFDLASALDHLAVAIAPPENSEHVYFPIFATDPLAKDARGRHLNKRHRKSWHRCIKGMPDEAIALITASQPHTVSAMNGTDPATNPLDVLRRFQNADKHRELLLLVSGIHSAVVSCSDGLTVPMPDLVENRAVLRLSDAQVQVHVEGTQEIVVCEGRSLDIRDYPLAVGSMFSVVNVIIDALERFARPEVPDIEFFARLAGMEPRRDFLNDAFRAITAAVRPGPP